MDSTDGFWALIIAIAGAFAGYFLIVFVIMVIVSVVLFVLGLALPFLAWALVWGGIMTLAAWPLRLQHKKKFARKYVVATSAALLIVGVVGGSYGAAKTFHIPKEHGDSMKLSLGPFDLFGHGGDDEGDEMKYSEHGRYINDGHGKAWDCANKTIDGNHPGACYDYRKWLQEESFNHGRVLVPTDGKVDSRFGGLPAGSIDCNDYVETRDQAVTQCGDYFSWLDSETNPSAETVQLVTTTSTTIPPPPTPRYLYAITSTAVDSEHSQISVSGVDCARPETWGIYSSVSGLSVRDDCYEYQNWIRSGGIPTEEPPYNNPPARTVVVQGQSYDCSQYYYGFGSSEETPVKDACTPWRTYNAWQMLHH